MRLGVVLAVLALAAGTVVAAALEASPHVETVLAAGNIATCAGKGDERTAAIVAREPGTVLTLGNAAYPRGTSLDYARCYGRSWGRFRSRTRPAPGSRDYLTQEAGPYRSYFGLDRTYDAFDLGSWRLYALDSENVSSAELAWLRRDLERQPHRCVLAFWDRPRFSSGAHGDQERVRPFWQLLYAAGAEIVLSGHDADYERFTRLTPTGDPDWFNGIREFVVGTGGARLSADVRTDSRTRAVEWWAPGILRLRLGSRGYSWRFLSAGGPVIDFGGEPCHGEPS